MGESDNFSQRISAQCDNLTGSDSGASETTDHGGLEYKTVLTATYENFVKQMTTAADKLQKAYTEREEGSCLLWFRGQQNGTLPLLPPLLRKEKLNRRRNDWELCPADTMGNALNDQPGGEPLAVRLAHLKKKSGGTTFLEFTESGLGALYYAFRKYLERPESAECNEASEKPALFILSPTLYNRALKEMLGEGTGNLSYTGEPKTASWIKSLGTSPPSLTNIEDMSTSSLRFFLSRDEEARGGETEGKGIKNFFNQAQWDVPKYPIAVCVRGVSPPANEETCCFVAYNSFISYDLYCKSYVSLDLEAIQKEYLAGDNNREAFMYKVVFQMQTKEDGLMYARQLKVLDTSIVREESI